MTETIARCVQVALAAWAGAEWLLTFGRRKLTDPFGWCIAMLAVLSWTGGDLLRLLPLAAGSAVRQTPAASHVLSGLWGLFAAGATWRIATRQSRTARSRLYLDSAMILTSLLVISWSSLLGPTLRTGAGSGYAGLSAAAHAALLFHGLCDAIMLAGILILCSRLPRLRSGPMLFMLLGQLSIFAGDCIEVVTRAHGTVGSAPLGAELAWTVGAASFALNARRLRVVMLLGAEPVPALSFQSPVSRIGLTLPYLPLVAIVAFSADRAARRVAWQPVETWLSMVAVLVVMARQMLVLFDNRRLLRALGEREVRLREQAFHDPLTGLANRLLFGEQLDAAVAALPAVTELAILFCDLDDFKRINDHLGHAVGDRLLQITAERLRACAPPQALVARLGGDEFALLITGSQGAPDRIASQIMSTFCEPVELDGEPLHVVVSIGIGRVEPGSVCAASDLLSRADLAMLAAKGQGKGRYATFDPAMKPADLRDRRLVNDFAGALRDGRLSAAYQPIVDLRSGKVVGIEALARWHHPERGPVSPERFIPLAEATGLIGTMTRHMFGLIAADSAGWAHGDGTPFISVNLSPTVLMSQGFASLVQDELDNGLRAESLVLEVTDGHAIPEGPGIRSTLRRLHETGVRLALDDFGDGRHTLQNLRWLPIDMIKIDREIIAAAGQSARGEALLASYVAMGDALGLRVIGTGVETSKQANRLMDIGCPWGQGYLFSRPLPADEIGKLLCRGAAAAPSDTLPAARTTLDNELPQQLASGGEQLGIA